MKAAYIITGLLALASPAIAQQAQTPPPRDGRYAIVFSPRVERDTFLLDTATGRVWQLTQYTFLEGEPSAWATLPRLDSDQDETNFVRRNVRKPVEPPAIPTAPKP